MVRSAKNEVSRCTKSMHLTLFYALTNVICVPIEASLQAYWVVFGLYIGPLFTFMLVLLIFCFFNRLVLLVFEQFCCFLDIPHPIPVKRVF